MQCMPVTMKEGERDAAQRDADLCAVVCRHTFYQVSSQHQNKRNNNYCVVASVTIINYACHTEVKIHY